MTFLTRKVATPALATLLAVLAIGSPAADGVHAFGRAEFTDRRDPPPRRTLDAATQADFDLGLLVFNTTWVEAGTPNAERRDGLGPLFISSSCDACHNNGARGRPPAEAGGLSNSLVMQLSGSDELYGAVLNTAALADHSREGRIEVRWRERRGRYADGIPWRLREPRYRLRDLLYGPPARDAVLRPRIGAQVFGSGLLESVSQQALQALQQQQPPALRGQLPLGRLGWQAEAGHIRDQSARAFAREMGLTSPPRPQDDCTEAQVACRNGPQGSQRGVPEVSIQFMNAIEVYQRELAVPARRSLAADREAAGARLFAQVGCATCHTSTLPVTADGRAETIDAYTDLLLHDLGEGLADRRQDGRVVPSLWRTAPLWGLAQARRFDGIALLHDGRAASVEEAILWHDGQGRQARRAFMRLPATERAQLLEWVESL